VLKPALFDRYLEVLGVSPGPPSSGLLAELVSAQLVAAPFENISKLYRHRTTGSTTIPSLGEYLDGIETWRLGGTCYVNNSHFFSLLDQLGFEVSLCGADMNRPDVHMVSMVRIEGRELMVDVGYAAPFFQPLPRDLDDEHVIDFGSSRYVLQPQDEQRRSRLELIRDGVPIHGYLAKPQPRTLLYFDAVIADSFRPEQTFMNAVVIERFTTEGGSNRIHNLKLIETRPDGPSTTTAVADLHELIDVIEHRFGVPAEVTRTAIRGVDLTAEIYS
jgi:arylamine N-acetyltransferase